MLEAEGRRKRRSSFQQFNSLAIRHISVSLSLADVSIQSDDSLQYKVDVALHTTKRTTLKSKKGELLLPQHKENQTLQRLMKVRGRQRLVGSDGNLDLNARLDRHRSLMERKTRNWVNQLLFESR